MTEELSDFNKNLKKAMGVRDKNPRMSVNKLAEYMIADPLRRRGLVKDQKHQKPFKAARYNEARTAIKEYLGSNYNESMIEVVIENLTAKGSLEDWQKDNRDNSVLALEKILDTDLPDLEDYEVKYNDGENKLIRLSGLDISVNPDVLLTHKDTGKIGGIKVHISKIHELHDPALRYVATMVKYSFIDAGIDEKKIDNDACISIDVFGSSYDKSPKSYKQTLGRIEAACEEICMRWERI